jgi:hypothetical protein
MILIVWDVVEQAEDVMSFCGVQKSWLSSPVAVLML